VAHLPEKLSNTTDLPIPSDGPWSIPRWGHLLLAVWREACRNPEIGSGLAESAADLFRRLPADLVLVRRFDFARQCVETVATGECRPHVAPSEFPAESRTDLNAEQFDRLISWCAEGQVIGCGVTPADDVPPGLLPLGMTGEALVGPLMAAQGPIGLVIFAAKAAGTWRPRHERVVRLLLEPITVWLENDRRLRELSALREAAEADNRKLLSRLDRHDMSDSIIGAKTGLKEVMQRVEQVARADVPVLILGETGAGKEVVARAIHEHSPRAAGPFMRVNCGAIPPDLVDSELFGHERGSFTGAVGLRKGWFERADGGTLFLDECGELPLAAQVRLLRILQDGSFLRVGGEKPVTVSVRVVAATHRDLQSMISDKSFRADLWYRISIFPINLPPLRDRVEDIPEMAANFAAHAAHRLGAPPLLPTPRELQMLCEYSWPGNVRELAAVIERAVILGDGKSLEIEKALGRVPESRGAKGALNYEAATNYSDTNGVGANIASMNEAAAGISTSGEFSSLDIAMARHIEAALVRTQGRVEGPFGAAQLLQINPHTLRGRMRSLGVDWRRFRDRLNGSK
jgi:hydrogenase-4 transcriptional activator